ncbi:MAG: hypothetical protein A3G27_13230 [Betaproteobacteria bacterium RIFCSPLOWO2_12_FULL_66_14]|nr:MAG: hypothetical protein A3G27_13230 [Betaproteobacteria bacterium RIFCSPLOWO2_12_FULL_66_14]
MSSLETYLVLGLGFVVFAVFLYALANSAWRMLHADGGLRLEQMLGRRGVQLAAAGEHAPYDAAVAARRCANCADKAACDAWLASGRRDGFEAFCPNADFIGRSAP